MMKLFETPPPAPKIEPVEPSDPIPIGARVKIIYPCRHGPEIVIEARVVKAKHPDYWLDTEHQKGIQMRRKDLQPV